MRRALLGLAMALQACKSTGVPPTTPLAARSPVARNLISDNTNHGVEIFGTGTSGNVVAGNFIGTDSTGTVAIANGNGVEIDSGASGNTIGGLTSTPGTGLGNLISGNHTGVFITDAGTMDNVVAGNLIGTDITGTVAIANGNDGVEIDSGASGNTIGGLASTPGTGLGNVISGNTVEGVEITGSGSSSNEVAGNIIGLNAAGTSALGNVADGVVIDTSASGNTIGGPTASAATSSPTT